MNENDFTGSIVGQVKWVYNRRYCYFCANPLPHDFKSTGNDIRRSRNIASAISRLDGKISQMDERLRNIISNILSIRESVYSCKLSAFDVSIDDVFRSERGSERTAGIVEYLNCRAAAEHGIRTVMEKGTINFDTLLDLHKILLGKERATWKNAGEMRVEQNAIGGESLDTAKFVPIDPGSLPKMMGNWHRYVGNSLEEPIIKMITAHYQFELIQPFMDGNGRIGRILMMLMALCEGLSEHQTGCISEYLFFNKEEYLKRLYLLTAKDQYEEWLTFCLDAISEQTERTSELSDRINKLYSKMTADETGNRAMVIDMLFDNPYIRVEDVMAATGMTRPGALKLIYALESEGKIKEITGRQRNRLYVSSSILEVYS